MVHASYFPTRPAFDVPPPFYKLFVRSTPLTQADAPTSLRHVLRNDKT
jgi:hypothetical protein